MSLDFSGLSNSELSALQNALTPKWTKYIPITPTPKQTAALLMDNVKELLYGGAAGGGKDLEVYTPILTANRGWTTMGDIRVGDYVYSIFGKPTRVIWKSEVLYNRCYKLTFDKGRETFIAGEGHQWFTMRRRQDRRERVPEILKTADIYTRFSKNAPRNRGSLFTVPCAPALSHEEVELPIDPYVFGVWLGDGDRQSGNISSVDVEIQEQFMLRGYDVYFTGSSIQHDRDDIHPGGREHHWCSKRLRDELRAMGFLYGSYDAPVEKDIPDVFFTASAEQRLELLRGMMDTDDCAINRPTGDVELNLANEHLAMQFEELIRGLGMQVSAKKSYDMRDNPRYPLGLYTRYRLNWTTGTSLFYVKRKSDRQATAAPTTARWHYLSNIAPCDTVPTQCIQIEDKSHCYLVGRTLIPTHNSVFLLAAALQYVDVPGYAAILFRKTFADLNLPGALIPMSKSWLAPYIDSGAVHWQEKEKRYTFKESGATLSFGYLENPDDHLRYQGAEFQFVGMDECTHIRPESYRYLFSRTRRNKKMSAQVPIRFRATANPGGQYGDYYYERFFVDNLKPDGAPRRFFLPSGLNDNPHLDVEAYRESLAELDPITREQLENGNWEIRPSGDMFDKNWLIPIDPQAYPGGVRWVRFWDLAAVDPKKKKKIGGGEYRADYTVGFKLGMYRGDYYIDDIIRCQKSPGDIETIVRNAAVHDGYSCAVRMEEEGGASGIANTERYSKYVLPGFDFVGVKPVVSKAERARPVAAAAQTGRIYISTRCRELTNFMAQLEAFPNGANDDMVDAFSGAFAYFKPSMDNLTPPDEILRARERVRVTTSSITEYSRTPYGGSYWLGGMRNRR